MNVTMKAVGHGYHAILIDGERDERFTIGKCEHNGRNEYWAQFEGEYLTGYRESRYMPRREVIRAAEKLLAA